MKLLQRFLGRRSPEAASRHVEREIDGTLTITTRPPAGSDARDITMSGVRKSIAGEVRDLMERISDLTVKQRLQNDGDTIGGPLVHEHQPAIHIGTVRVASRTIEPGADEVLRVVDYGKEADGGFPAALVATHLSALAEIESARSKRLALLRESISLYPGAPAKIDTRFAFDRGENVGNWYAWSLYGETLVESGSVEQGLEALEQAVLRCPAWAADFAAHVQATVERSGVDPGIDPRIAFWSRYAEAAKQ